MTDKKTGVKQRVGDGTPGPGRPKGSRNKTTMQLKEMILTALDKKGGVEYLVQQAEENPTAFISLLNKVLPMTVSGDIEHKFTGLRVTIKR